MARPCGQGSIAGLMRSLPHYHANSLILARAIFSVRIVVKIAATVFQAVPHLADDVDRNEGHPPLLIGTEGLVERLPRASELADIGRSLRQGRGAPLHEGDRIAIPQGLDGA